MRKGDSASFPPATVRPPSASFSSTCLSLLLLRPRRNKRRGFLIPPSLHHWSAPRSRDRRTPPPPPSSVAVASAFQGRRGRGKEGGSLKQEERGKRGGGGGGGGGILAWCRSRLSYLLSLPRRWRREAGKEKDRQEQKAKSGGGNRTPLHFFSPLLSGRAPTSSPSISLYVIFYQPRFHTLSQVGGKCLQSYFTSTQ